MRKEPYLPTSASPQIQIQKRGGCLSFFLGFLTGLIFPVLVVGLFIGGLTLYGDQIFQSAVPNLVQGYYKNVIREDIKKSLQLPESEKEEVLQGIDKMMENFPQMSPEEMQQAIDEIIGQPQDFPNQNP